MPVAAPAKPVPASAISAQLGARVRVLRDAIGISLRELAERSGVSPQLLSQVERGETSPTLTTAERIAAGLDLRLSQLLRIDEGGLEVTLVPAGTARTGGRDGHSYELLTPPLPGQRAEVSRHSLEAGAGTGSAGDPALHEAGSRETALVERGAVTLICDEVRYALGEGDAVTFDADLPHRFVNESSSQAELVAVVSAGLRRS